MTVIVVNVREIGDDHHERIQKIGDLIQEPLTLAFPWDPLEVIAKYMRGPDFPILKFLYA